MLIMEVPLGLWALLFFTYFLLSRNRRGIYFVTGLFCIEETYIQKQLTKFSKSTMISSFLISPLINLFVYIWLTREVGSVAFQITSVFGYAEWSSNNNICSFAMTTYWELSDRDFQDSLLFIRPILWRYI